MLLGLTKVHAGHYSFTLMQSLKFKMKASGPTDGEQFTFYHTH